jgi:hypothetical protein
MEQFIVKHYTDDNHTTIKGNGFDGTKLGEDREDAEEFLTPINKMIDLCNEFFVDYMVQPYAGANRECLYCGATEQRDGSVDHSAADCPVLKYKLILDS